MANFTRHDPPTTGVRFEEPTTSVYVNNVHVGSGTLYVAENALYWLKGCGQGFKIRYQDIPAHGIYGSDDDFPVGGLFIMVIQKVNGAVEDNNDDDESETLEMRLVPRPETSVQEMYNALRVCSAMNPDPIPHDDDSDEVDEQDDQDENFADAENDDGDDEDQEGEEEKEEVDEVDG